MRADPQHEKYAAELPVTKEHARVLDGQVEKKNAVRVIRGDQRRIDKGRTATKLFVPLDPPLVVVEPFAGDTAGRCIGRPHPI